MAEIVKVDSPNKPLVRLAGLPVATLTPILIFMLCVHAAHAQEPAQPQPDSLPATPEPTTVEAPGPAGQPFQMGPQMPVSRLDTTQVHRSIRSRSFFSSPTGALLRSVAFPGWGQWSNGKKQKAAIYFAIESYWITKSLVWRHRARTAEDFSEFTHARDRRNYFYWLTGITVFISMFDAYADRYLLTLEKTRKLGDEFWGARDPGLSDDQWRLMLSIRF